MIVDADVHISPTPEGGNSIGVDELLRRLDRAGVDQALTWLQPPYTRDLDAANAYVHHAATAHPDRILGFGWADPNLGLSKARETVRRCLEDYGFPGVKLNGAQNSFYLDSPDLSLPLIEEIAARNAVLAFHVGGDAYEHTHPFRVAKVARRFPSLRILVVHMGGAAFHDLADAAIEFAQECQNLTLVGSAVNPIKVLKAIRTLGAERVCFGSDTPFALMHVEVAKYRALLHGEVSPEAEAAVMGGTLRRLLAGREPAA